MENPPGERESLSCLTKFTTTYPEQLEDCQWHHKGYDVEVIQGSEGLQEDEQGKNMATLEGFFSQAQRRKKRSIPGYLHGKIVFELFGEPSITSGGINYYQTDIEEHLQHVAHSAPLTQSILTQATYVKHCYEGRDCYLIIKE